MPNKQNEQNTGSRNEGEGNKTAAREYNEVQRRFAESGKVDEKARVNSNIPSIKRARPSRLALCDGAGH